MTLPNPGGSFTRGEQNRGRRGITSAHRGRHRSNLASATTYDADLVLAGVPAARADALVFIPRRRWEPLNRIVNFMFASVALIVAAPVMLFVALAVAITSRGSVVYAQTRVGIDRRARPTNAVFDRRGSDVGGSCFTIYKFRTMRWDAEKITGAVWATRNDPRCTPIGNFLRRTRLDELPQLFNVLRGDMNIVGPRPERPSIFQSLRNDIAEYPLRQRTKPGITGWAQINHDYDATVDDVRTKVQYDLEYLAKQSLWEDIKIMAKTIPVILFRKGGW